VLSLLREPACAAETTRGSPPPQSKWRSLNVPAWPQGINTTLRQIGLTVVIAALTRTFQ